MGYLGALGESNTSLGTSRTLQLGGIYGGQNILFVPLQGRPKVTVGLATSSVGRTVRVTFGLLQGTSFLNLGRLLYSPDHAGECLQRSFSVSGGVFVLSFREIGIFGQTNTDIQVQVVAV